MSNLGFSSLISSLSWRADSQVQSATSNACALVAGNRVCGAPGQGCVLDSVPWLLLRSLKRVKTPALKQGCVRMLCAAPLPRPDLRQHQRQDFCRFHHWAGTRQKAPGKIGHGGFGPRLVAGRTQRWCWGSTSGPPFAHVRLTRRLLSPCHVLVHLADSG